ncbi:hypothetical protein QJS04_geneDACA008566 [Acorus gramineus]|uniref:LETM1-like protein n=1 Tax=Acorus gramineus TaxID=55184 RepID=A0AAV9AHU6_ACOGR|nr:hypothetical protein QJS04_geneDACA008566 [Acorus gramineus]
MPQASSSSELEEMRTKLDQSLQGEDLNGALIQSLHDAARAIELAIREHGSSSRIYWFSSAWLGVDKNAWVKTLSYQAAVNCLLQAAVEISSRGDGRDRDTNIFVQRSLLKQSSPLESLIREELSAKQPGAYEWFWDQQHPMVVTNFVNLLERDPHFNAATTLFSRGVSSSSEKTGDISLIMLALSCIAAIMKLGPAKVSCSPFFSIMPEVIGRLMDMLIDFVPISQAYHSLKEIGLRREFLLHFGPRAAACKPKTGQSAEELAFWVDIVQQKLQRAIDRERIWSRLTTCESIEVLEKDLAIFGFFIALGRRTQAFLSANGIDTIDDPIESIIRHIKLKECVHELGISETELKEDSEQNSSSTTGFRNLPLAETELESFDQALESVEEALKRLEDLLQELHLSNAGSGKEHLKAACSDLERIRKLKNEAEFLEASFRAKAASLQQEEDGRSESSTSKLQRYSDKMGGRGSGPKKNVREKGRRLADRKSTKGRGLWNFLEDEADENFVTSATISNEDTDSNEIRRFEILRHELIELEKRVQRSADGTQVEEEENLINEKVKHAAEAGSHKLVQDVWQGTQLLAIDVVAATMLLKRALTGDELAEKEKKALRRTLTDLASVLPIGFLMLLPVYLST